MGIPDMTITEINITLLLVHILTVLGYTEWIYLI